MHLKKFILLAAILQVSFNAFTQRRLWDGDYNRPGLQAGANQFLIATNNFETTAKISWTAGFTTRSSFYENLQFIYGINFFNFKLGIQGRENADLNSLPEEIEFNLLGVQGNFFASYKLIDHFLSVEAGPVVQVNGKLKAKEMNELWYLGNYNLQAGELESISTFNINLAAGISGGLEGVKLWVQYQYGLNNIFKGLDDEGLELKDAELSDLEGHISMVVAGITVYL